MTVIEKSIVIRAPIEQVFETLNDPQRVQQFAPDVSRVDAVQETANHIGASFRAVYSVMGIDIPTTFTVIDYAKPHKLVARMEGGQTGTFSWQLEPRGDATHVTVRIDYQLKGGLLGRAVDALLVERMNEKNTGHMLENLKTLSEAR